MLKHRSLIAALAVFTLGASAASAAHILDSNGNTWINYVGDHPFGNTPWGIHLEAQNRRSDMGGDWQQLLLRTGINYTVNPTLMLTAGYAWVQTYPYGDYPVAHEFPEHRIWQQAQITQKALGLTWTHRFRLEQRFIGEEKLQPDGGWAVNNWRYQNRVRYMLGTTIPLSADKKWYLAVWDELFVNFGPHRTTNTPSSHHSFSWFDQNRAFIGIGRKLSDTTSLEVGYMEQNVRHRDGFVYEANHTLSIWLKSKWAIKF